MVDGTASQSISEFGETRIRIRIQTPSPTRTAIQNVTRSVQKKKRKGCGGKDLHKRKVLSLE